MIYLLPLLLALLVGGCANHRDFPDTCYHGEVIPYKDLHLRVYEEYPCKTDNHFYDEKGNKVKM